MADAELPPNDPEPEMEAGDVPKARSTRARRGVALAVVLLVTTAAVAFVISSGKQTPDEQLAEVLDFVDEHKTARVKGTSVLRYGPEEGDVGSTSTDRSRVEGVVKFPTSSRLVEDDGEYVYETLTVDGATYSREGESPDDLAGEPWMHYEEWTEEGLSEEGQAVVEGMSDDELASLSQATGVFSSTGVPLDLRGTLQDPEAVSRPEPGLLSLKLTARDFIPDDIEEEFEALMEAEGEDIDEYLDAVVMVSLRHGAGGRLDELVMESTVDIDGEEEHTKLELTFSRWGEPVDIEAPGDDELDRTPSIDEVALAEFDTFEVLAPTQVPAGYLLQDLTVDEEDEEFEACATTSLTYGPPDELPVLSDEPSDDQEAALGQFLAREIHVTQSDATCEHNEDPEADASEGREVVVGGRSGRLYDNSLGYGGHYALGEDAGRSLVLRVGDTWLVIATGLGEDELLRVAASLAPLDLRTQPIELDELPER